MARITKAEAGQAADDYLALKAAQAELTAKENALKSTMLAFYKATGRAEIEGQVARVTISEVPGRETVDMERLALLIPAPVLAGLMKRGSPSTRFNCRARVAK